VRARADAFLYSAVGALNLADMTVGGDDLEMKGSKVSASALELVVTVNGANDETPLGVHGDDGAEFLGDRVLRAVGDGGGSPKLNVAGDGVDEWLSLDEEEIGAENDIAVMLVNVRRDGNCVKTGDAGGFASACGLPLKSGNVGAVYDCRALRVGDCDGTVVDVVRAKELVEFGLAGAAEQTVEAAGGVGVGHVARGKKLLLFLHRR
jgi:hypothetical protein